MPLCFSFLLLQKICRNDFLCSSFFSKSCLGRPGKIEGEEQVDWNYMDLGSLVEKRLEDDSKVTCMVNTV